MYGKIAWPLVEQGDVISVMGRAVWCEHFPQGLVCVVCYMVKGKKKNILNVQYFLYNVYAKWTLAFNEH